MPRFLFDGSESARPTLVLAHGAGAGPDSPFMNRIAQGLAGRGARIARFAFPYMEARRIDGRRRPPDRPSVLIETWREAIAALGGGAGLVIGGKSMGGRIASLIADETGARGLVCLGFPFHAPGRPAGARIDHLATIRTPTLIVQGTRDALGGRDEVAGYALSDAVRVAWIEDGDHSFAPRKSAGRTLDQNLAAAIEAVADFLASLPAP